MIKKKHLVPLRWAALSSICFLLIVSASAGFGTGKAPASLVDKPCIAPDDGTGTVDLPPNACDYSSALEVFGITDGLPAGTTIELTPIFTDFTCPPGGCGQPGGNFGGEQEVFESTLVFQLRGTGDLDGFRRTLRVPVAVETHSGPRTPGQPVQTFPTDLYDLQGVLYGDPDFGEFRLTAGTNYGLPSPGQTTLTDRGDGTFVVDSFFDISYRIDFVGAPGGWLGGLAGSTTGTVRTEAIDRQPASIGFDNGDGTVTLPPLRSQYLALTDDWAIIEGLPPGTTIVIEPTLRDFVCIPICGQPGGVLGGQVENFSAVLDLKLTGSGDLAGFSRLLSLPATVETRSGPRSLGAPVQAFRTDLASLEALLVADPDFASLTITAGTSLGLPSPGHATLTTQGGGLYMVDSFFDIHYQIDFTGAPGGALEGMAGTSYGYGSLTAFHNPYAKPYRAWLPLVKR